MEGTYLKTNFSQFGFSVRLLLTICLDFLPCYSHVLIFIFLSLYEPLFWDLIAQVDLTWETNAEFYLSRRGSGEYGAGF